MTYQLNKTQARSHARSQLNIFDEVNSVMRKVIVASDAGLYSVTVDDGTTMTESTPVIVITGTKATPVITGTPTVILGGTTITLGTTGLSLNAVIADINDAAITGLVASKDTSDKLVLTYTAPAATSWSFTIGAGTANTALGLDAAAGTTTATDPSSVTYNNVHTGAVTDRKSDDEMTQVRLYFTNLGYNIQQQTNTVTGKTFKWIIYW